MQRNSRRGEAHSTTATHHDRAPHFITEFTPRIPAFPSRRTTPTPTHFCPPSSPHPSPALPLTPSPAPPYDIDRILPLVRSGQYQRALLLYQSHATLLTPLPPSHSTQRDLAHVHRMMGDCYGALGRWEEARLSLLSALHHCEESISLLPHCSPSYPSLIAHQQILHLLGDAHTALSEASPNPQPPNPSPSHPTPHSLALTALSYASRAEEEAQALLTDDAERGAEEEREVKEAVLSAKINVAIAHCRFITLSSPQPQTPTLTPTSSPSAELHPPSYHLREAKRQLRRAYQSARSFALHQYEFLCQWHLMRVEVMGDVGGEAVRHVREGLTVFERCRSDARSRTLEWGEAEWKADERSLLIEGAALVCDIVEGGRGEEEGGERRELIAEAFGWINRVRMQIKGGEVELDEEERRRVVRLFNRLRQRQAELDQVSQVGATGAGTGERSVEVTSTVKRRKVIED